MSISKKIIVLGCLLAGLLSAGPVRSQTEALKDSLVRISADARGTVGISLLPIESGKALSINGSLHLPMQSVFKFPLGICVLDQVDKGKLSLDRKIHVSAADWIKNMYSPMRDKYQAAEADITIREMLSFTVSNSDNNGCDLLFRLLGGPKKVNDYIHSLGIKDIAIVATESEMHAAWDVQYGNWCTADAMASLLRLVYFGKCLSPSGNTLLMELLTATDTGPRRIKGLLDPGTVVAHKTGSSDTNKGIASATNDAGIITLPNGQHLIVVVFVSDARADEATRESVIARIAKAAVTYYR
jgi:beta-lactamase class A